MEKLVYLCWKRSELPIAAFREHWLGHTADAVLSEGARALTLNIVRNAVARSLSPGAPPYRGIVEERVAELEDALDMRRFFRGSLANIEKGMADVDGFLDRAQIAATLMSEYIIAG